MRSPLSSLISLQQLIVLDFCESREEERQFIEQAYQASQKLLAMLDQVVQVSKIDYGAIILTPEVVNLSDILIELQTYIALPLANHHIPLRRIRYLCGTVATMSKIVLCHFRRM
ncbi:MAG: hypothetical protein ACKOX2_11830 [Microcystaceae cyanobacterium]